MLKQRIALTRNVASKLNMYEQAIDQAAILGSELLADTLQGRINARLAAEVGQDGISKLVQSLETINRARTEAVEGHQAFLQTAKDIKTEVYAGGDLWKIIPSAQAESDNDDSRDEDSVTGTDG